MSDNIEMTAQEQLDWCLKNKATVYFGSGKGVSVKVRDRYGTTSCQTLQQAIEHIESARKQNKELQERHPEE